MKFSSRQKRILLSCVLIYTTAYLNRLNLSAALGSLTADLAVSTAQAGLLQTAFAAVYALGQFVNGAIVDRVQPRFYLLAGIAGSAVCNLLMGTTGSYQALLALCLMNGAFQSMLWTPIVRLLAIGFQEQQKRERANMCVSLTLVMGHLGAWGISGYLSGLLSWRWSFIAPALIALPVMAASVFLLPSEKMQAAEKKKEKQGAQPVGKVFASTGFYLVLFGCVLYGFVKDGVVTWSPSILQAAGGGSALNSTAFSLIVPLINAVGIWVGYSLKRRSALPHRRMIAVMLVAGAAFCVPLMAGMPMLAMALLLGCVCACMYGLNPMLTAMLPLEYDRWGRIGLAAGLIDSLIYAGSALAGVAAGWLYDGMGAGALYAAWALCALLAAAAMWCSVKKRVPKDA